jgi:hypothetical protein
VNRPLWQRKRRADVAECARAHLEIADGHTFSLSGEGRDEGFPIAIFPAAAPWQERDEVNCLEGAGLTGYRSVAESRTKTIQ